MLSQAPSAQGDSSTAVLVGASPAAASVCAALQGVLNLLNVSFSIPGAQGHGLAYISRVLEMGRKS